MSEQDKVKYNEHWKEGCPLRPTDNKIVLVMDEADDKIGTIFLPDTAKEIPAKGRVVAVGPGKWNEPKEGGSLIRMPMPVSVGDCVLVAKWGGNDVEVEEKKYKIIQDYDIMAIVDADAVIKRIK